MAHADKVVVGWREWVALPSLGVPWIKAKIDTGARSSALHAFELEVVEVAGKPVARFVIHPWQRSSDDAVEVEAPVIDLRTVRSSNGTSERRPVIVTPLRIGEQTLAVEVTLTRRDHMGFRLLIGRQALAHGLLVDPERSFACGRPPLPVRRANRRWQRS